MSSPKRRTWIALPARNQALPQRRYSFAIAGMTDAPMSSIERIVVA
jgi:hypothetical protein